MNIFKERRIGTFELDQETIRRNYRLLFKLFAKVIVTSAGSEFPTDPVKYVGYSELFAPVGEGGTPPRYRVSYNRRKREWEATPA